MKRKQLKSSAKSTQKKKKFFVSVEHRAIPQFLIFYWLCPLVWSTEIEKGRENEKVGGNQAKLNGRGSRRELEKGAGEGTREKQRKEAQFYWRATGERERERNRELRRNFTDEQLDNERERVRENRRRTSDERQRREREIARENRRRISLSLNEDEREGGEGEWLSANFLCIECKTFWLFQER